MYTETELRGALEHSASRAETLADRVVTTRPKRHLLPALAAAAVIIAVVAGGVALQGRSNEHAPSSAHVPADLSSVVDQMRAGNNAGISYSMPANSLGGRTEGIWADLGRRSIGVTLVDSSAFDPARIPRDRPVPIAGTTGYFSKFKLYPLDGSPTTGGGRWIPIWTIAFQDPAGKWVFVYINSDIRPAGFAQPAWIASRYAKLNIDFVEGRTRLPFRTGYLPSGYRVMGVTVRHGYWVAALTNGDETVTISVEYLPRGSCRTLCRTTRRIGDYTIGVGARYNQVMSDGGQRSDPKLAARVFDSLTIASKLGDPSTYWTIADALG